MRAVPEPGYVLVLCEDVLPAGRGHTLPPANRVLYVRAGEVVVSAGGRETRLPPGQAWHGAGEAAMVAAGPADATVLRWELAHGGGAAARPAAGVTTRVLLAHAIELDPRAPYLMRCDRVDFAPGGVALPHRHRGGGIRCLLAGALDVTVGDAPARTMTPGSAWFESGREPVLAVASKDAPTSFVRVSVLPRELRGRTSIMYVDPADAERGRPRSYTVWVDEPIELA